MYEFIDSHKLDLHPHRVADWLDGKDIYPIYLEVSPSGACNQRCSFCAFDYLDYEPEFLDLERMDTMWREMADLGIKSIMLAGEGEPLMSEDIIPLIQHIYSAGIDVSMTTNGALIDDQFIEYGLVALSWIKVSVNAGLAETYKKIHGTDDFDKVLSNIRKMVAFKKSKPFLGGLTIGVQMVALQNNLKEIPELADHCKKIEVDYFSVKAYSKHPMTDKKVITPDVIVPYNIFDVIYRNPNIRRKYDKCYAVPFFWAYIRSNADVYACSNFLGDERFKIGNLYEQDFKDIWNSDKRKEIMEYVDNMDIKKECRSLCRMNRCNEYLYRLKHPDNHTNFI